MTHKEFTSICFINKINIGNIGRDLASQLSLHYQHCKEQTGKYMRACTNSILVAAALKNNACGLYAYSE